MANNDPKKYTDEIDAAIELLSHTFANLGRSETERDSELIDAAARKLQTLFDLLVAGGFPRNLLEIIMRD